MLKVFEKRHPSGHPSGMKPHKLKYTLTDGRILSGIYHVIAVGTLIQVYDIEIFVRFVSGPP